MLVRATSSVRMRSGAPSSLTMTSTGLPSAIGRASPRKPAEHGPQVDDGRVDAQLPRLGLRDIKKVVDQREQHAARVLDELDLVEPFGIEAPPSAVGSASSRASPMMELSGVRSSWLMLAQNLSLDSEAARSR